MMRCTARLLLLFLGFLLAGCQSINRKRVELGIPQSLVIFSFDDGPNIQGDTTARLLDVLKKYQIHALFSLLGENAEHAPELVRRIYDEGHYIVNHGYSDKWAYGMGEDDFLNNLARGEAAITAALGHDLYPKLYRPHGGFYKSGQEKILHETGYTLISSTIRAYDAVMTGAELSNITKKIINKAERQGGGIILLHDGRDSHFRMEKKLEKNPYGVFDRSWIPNAVEEIIIALLDKGFVLNNSDILPALGIDVKYISPYR